MHAQKVMFEFVSEVTLLSIIGIAYSYHICPCYLWVVIWCLFLKQMQLGGNSIMVFSKSYARLMTNSRGKLAFDDVAGI
ncbi:ATP-dependent zinc metalloprotease FtsH [Anaplasma phagocytophilum]|nr:ATP-dependent zinc metalloprotease FtsH [Anaplasma phagocytophilum]